MCLADDIVANALHPARYAWPNVAKEAFLPLCRNGLKRSARSGGRHHRLNIVDPESARRREANDSAQRNIDSRLQV